MSGPVLFDRVQQKCIDFHDLTEFTIGRSPSCNINILETCISRCQCVIKKMPEGEWLIQDKSSFKSTLLNGNKIPQSGVYLKSLDLITFNTLNSWQLVFHVSKDDVLPSLLNDAPPAKRRKRAVDDNPQVASQESRRSSPTAKSAQETSNPTISKYEEECQLLTNDLKAALNEKKDLESELKRLVEEKDRVDDILIGSHLDSKQLLEELEDCRSEVTRLAEERNELQAEIQEALVKKETSEAAGNPLGTQSQYSTSEMESNLIMKTIEVEELKDELQDAKAKLEKAEELVQSLSSQNEKVYNDAVAVLEQEFLCCVCSDLLYQPVTLNCRHTICRDCLNEWKKKKKECPSCRTKIKSEVSPLMVDAFIDRIAPLLGEEFLKKREESKTDRTAPSNPPPQAMPPAGPLRNSTGGRGRTRGRGRRGNQHQHHPYMPPAPAPHLVPGVIDLTNRSPARALPPPREPTNAADGAQMFSESDSDSSLSADESTDEYARVLLASSDESYMEDLLHAFQDEEAGDDYYYSDEEVHGDEVDDDDEVDDEEVDDDEVDDDDVDDEE